MKKLISGLLVCAMLFSFAACGGADGNVGKIDADVVMPGDDYVLYKETATITGVVRLHEYNDKGHVTKISHIQPDGSFEDEIYDYTYNADGSYSFFKTGWGTEYIEKFDNKGRLVERINDPDSSRQKSLTYVYNDDNTVNYEKRDADGYIEMLEKMYYDENGLLVKTEHFRSDGLLLAYTEYSYDEYGNETTHIQYTPEGEKNSNNATYVWTQEYDEYGRLVKVEKRDTAIGGLYHEETHIYDDEARTYTETSETGKYVREYRPLSECIK